MSNNPEAYANRVKESLAKAIDYRNRGEYKAAEDLYIDACINMLLYSRLGSGSERRENLKRSRSILDGLIGLGRDGGSAEANRESGWRILTEIGIEKPSIPEVTMDDVSGLDGAKKELTQSLIYPIKYRDLSEKFGVSPSGGVLLYGPPGTGKTYIAKALANEAGANFINVSPARLYNQWFGEFEKNITKLFKAARLLSPSLVFFDEIESLAPSRGTESSEQVSKRGVSQLLMEMEGFEKNSDSSIFILAATNRPWDVDEALLRPGRFDVRVYVGLPDIKARARLFRMYLRNADSMKKEDFHALAGLTEGYSGADISYLCKRAAANMLARSIDSGRLLNMSLQSVIDMIEEVRPSVSKSTVQQYEKYSKSYI